VDRGQLRTVQFPRGFGAAALAQLLSGAGVADFDELDSVLEHGMPATLVDGDNDTMSIELPSDAAYLAAIIEGRRQHPDR